MALAPPLAVTSPRRRRACSRCVGRQRSDEGIGPGEVPPTRENYLRAALVAQPLEGGLVVGDRGHVVELAESLRQRKSSRRVVEHDGSPARNHCRDLCRSGSGADDRLCGDM